MALNKGWDRHFFINNVMEAGRSLNVTKGQFALVNNSAAPNKNGREVINNVNGLSKDTELVILQGVAKDGTPRTQSNKPWSTKEFKLSDVSALRVGVPSTDFQVDRFVVGYNGFDESTAIKLENGDNESLQVGLSGEAIGMLGYKDARADFTFEFGKPNTGTMTDQEVIEELVLRMRRAEFSGGVPITKYLDIDVVNSENPAVGGLTGVSTHTFFSLTVTDNGDSLGFAEVQAQYPTHKVVLTSRSGDESTYTIVAEETIVTGGAFVTGEDYIIKTVGTTNYTLIGASSNTVGERFTATGAGSGTGTATLVPVGEFTKFKRSKIKGCESCPAGYTELADGFVYSVTLADDGTDNSATVEAISANATVGSATQVNVDDNGVSYYSVVISEALTKAEIDAFVAANNTAVVELASADVQEICSPDNQVTTEWAAGDTCRATTEGYTMIVSDDECGTARTAELQAHYPDLTIALDSSAQCAGKYSTTVVTNIVCEECDDSFRDLFISEAPEDFREFHWSKVAKTYSATALMGIRLTGKKIELSGSEAYRDYMPFIASSVKLSVAGGYYNSQTFSFHEGSGDRLSVQIMSRATEPEYLGGNLQELEEMSRRYFEDESRQYQNAYGNWAKGEESLLNPTAPYVDYVLTVRIKTLTQGFSGEKNETFYYHFITEVGKHQAVEDILNQIATENGIAPVQAFGKV